MPTINDQKILLRKEVRLLKKNLPIEEQKKRSENIWLQVENESSFKNAKTIMLFWSIGGEVYTHDFIQKWYPQKQIILPVVEGENLRLKFFRGFCEMVVGENFGILEPSGKNIAESTKIDLIIVPGVAFDKQNNRMGRGKGYYDKLLKTSNAYTVGVCFDFQLFESIPVTEFDVKMDKVLTETYRQN